MKLTVRRAVIIAVLLGMLLPAIVAGLILTQFFYSNKLAAEINRSLENTTNVVALGVRESLWSLDKDSATTLIEALMQDPALVSIEILDPTLGKFVSREIPDRREGQIHSLSRPIVHAGETIGQIRVELSEAPLQHSLQTQLLSAAAVLGAQLIISMLLILYVLQRRVGHPLLRLSEEAAALARGELDRPIQALRPDEIGQVESQLEVTRQALQGLFRSLEQKNRTLEVDLRERMRVEAALRDREQRLRTLVEQNPLGVIEFDLGWHILDWNDAAARIFGWRREDVLGRHASMLLSRLTDTTPNHQLDLAMAGKQAQLHCLRADQGSIVCQWYNSLIRDGAGVGQRIVAMIEDITLRQHADNEIRRLAAVLRLSTNLVALADADGHIEWFNQAFKDSFGSQGENLRGALLNEVLREQTTPQHSPRIAEIEAAIQNGQALSGLELPVHIPSNWDCWLSLELQALRAEDHTVQQWVAQFTDVSDRHQMADALRNIAHIGADQNSGAFFERLLAILARGVGAQATCLATHDENSYKIQACWTSPDWTITPGTYPLQGMSAGRVGLDGPLLLKHNAYEAISQDPALSSCIRTEALIVEPIMDSTRRVLGHITMLFEAPLTQSAGVQSLVELGAARAAAEFLRQHTLQALQHSEQKFSTIFRSAPIPIALLRRADSICVDLNPSFLNHFGYPREALVGRRVADTPIYVDRAERQWVLDLLASTGEVSGAEMRLRTVEGDIRDCQIYVRPVTMGNDACLLIAAVDVTPLLESQRQVEELNQSLERRVVERTQALANANTELEKALEHLKRTLEELVHSEKLAALGSLVAGIAHELNTPIGNSLMVASTLRDTNRAFRDELEGGLRRSRLDMHIGESETAADILMRNLSRAAELISSFKQVAVDQTSSQRRAFDLAAVVGEIIVTMHPVFRKTPFLIDNQIPAGIHLNSYPGPFGQVLANLLNNTILHAFEGRDAGTITLSVEREGSEHIRFRCQDDGVGISPENLRRIFDPFFTTKLGRDGSGLGLNIVHNIVTGILGGEIRVDSTPGNGCCFTLRLPLQAPSGEPLQLDLSDTRA